MTSVGKVNFVFIWRIENFSLCPLGSTESLKSPHFKAENIGDSVWYLEVNPRGPRKDHEKYISCFLMPDGFNRDDRSIDFSLEMIGDDGEILRTWVVKDKVVEKRGWGLNEFITIDECNKKSENWIEDVLTIRCRITCKVELIPHASHECVAVTRINVHRCSFKWNIDLLDSTVKEYVKELFFTDKLRIKLICSNDEEFEMKIQRLDENILKSLCVSCKISLIDLKGDEAVSKASKYLFLKNSEQNDWNFPTFIIKKDLLEKKWLLKQNNVLTLKWEISASTGDNCSAITTKYEESNFLDSSFLDNSFSKLQEDLLNMFKTQKNADIKLQAENVTIPAHKNILSSRSPVFSAMFDQDMVENQTGVVSIEDLDAKTLNDLLEFIYTGAVNEMDFESAMKLLIAADKYQILSLTEKCAIFLKPKLSVENVCEVYALSDVISHEDLKSCAQKFIEVNLSKVLNSDTWSTWMKENVHLANEILFKVALNSSKRNV